MNDLAVHLLLFTLVALAIVICGAFFSDFDDVAALRTVPRRLLWFFGGCAMLAVVVLIIEHTVARVS